MVDRTEMNIGDGIPVELLFGDDYQHPPVSAALEIDGYLLHIGLKLDITPKKNPDDLTENVLCLPIIIVLTVIKTNWGRYLTDFGLAGQQIQTVKDWRSWL